MRLQTLSGDDLRGGPALPMSEQATTEGAGPGDGRPSEGVRIGTWNVSWWTGSRLAPVSSLGVQLLAMQETKLSALPLENARGSLKRMGYVLHHGHSVPAHRAGGHGDSCGVGILASPGVAVSPLMPHGAAWKRLHAMARVHAVMVPPRPGLAAGLRIFSVYAPLQRDPGRDVFTAAFLEMVACLDMQIPTLLLGDFNGTISPDRDFSTGEGQVCRLLTRLLGPGGPFLDLQMVVSPELFAYTFRSSRDQSLFFSRGDLALGNRAVLGMVQRVYVESGVMDGGHSPILLELRDSSPWALNWLAPRPRLPHLMYARAHELRDSEDWGSLLEEWTSSPSMVQLSQPHPDESAQHISTKLEAALQALVQCAGGWESRASSRRPAYESPAVRRLRNNLRLLGQCSAILHREQGVGSFSHSLLTLLQHLRQRGLAAPSSSRWDLEKWVEAQTVDTRRVLGVSLRAMRTERVLRWKNLIPT